ncbi:MAG: HAD-IA family hydrolase [Chloroflexota bacterium]|nr:HAD-IA family hydrolase [Chloroflexota bacterium]
MNDNQLRGRQWRRLVGEFFAPRLGGTPEDWGEANRVVAERMFELDAWLTRVRSSTSYESFERAYWLDWLGGMCELVGVPMPAEAESLELACRAESWITRRASAAYPGAVEAIRSLNARGIVLHTASGESSASLSGYLEGMGVRNCFGRLYGPDLIATFKEGPEYYERLLADVGVVPTDALVVDDNSRTVGWAAQTGARTVLVGGAALPDIGDTIRIRSLAELPDAVERLD